MKTYDYINRVVITLPLMVYEGTWTHSPLSLLCITMILRVRRNFFEITTFPNSGIILVLDLSLSEALPKFDDHHVVVLVVIPSTSPPSLAGSRSQRCHRVERVQITEVSYFRY